ncbi:sister-chromatid cohesion protein 3 [Tanacetum coccineum]
MEEEPEISEQNIRRSFTSKEIKLFWLLIFESDDAKEAAAAASLSFEVIKGSGKQIPQVVKLWVEQYEKDSKPAMAELLTMLFEACGAKFSIQGEFLDETNIDDVLVALVNMAAQDTIQSPKKKEFESFKENLMSFWDNLVSECQNGPLFDQVLFDKCMHYVIALSSTPTRVYRQHTVTWHGSVSISITVHTYLYLKYLGWTLNDKSAAVRKASILALQAVYDVDDYVPSLGPFTLRFYKRMLDLADDNDISVAECAISLSKQLKHQLLLDDDLCSSTLAKLRARRTSREENRR